MRTVPDDPAMNCYEEASSSSSDAIEQEPVTPPPANAAESAEGLICDENVSDTRNSENDTSDVSVGHGGEPGPFLFFERIPCSGNGYLDGPVARVGFVEAANVEETAEEIFKYIPAPLSEITETDLKKIILDILEGIPTAGGPETHLKYVNVSLRKICDELNANKIPISVPTLSLLVKELGYSSQHNKKYLSSHPRTEEVTAQIDHIMDVIADALTNPRVLLISIDTLHKVITGNRANKGTLYRPKNNPLLVNAYDFYTEETKTLIPFGIYNVKANTAHVSLSESGVTPELAGRVLTPYIRKALAENPAIEKVIILNDGGGANNHRCRGWKVVLQILASEFNVDFDVHHYPAGFSKYNPVEHKLWGHICSNWAGAPLLNPTLVKYYIENTRTNTWHTRPVTNPGLRVTCSLDGYACIAGVRIAETMKKAEFEALLKMERSKEYNSDLNYTIYPDTPERLKILTDLFEDAIKRAREKREKKAKKEEEAKKAEANNGSTEPQFEEMKSEETSPEKSAPLCA